MSNPYPEISSAFPNRPIWRWDRDPFQENLRDTARREVKGVDRYLNTSYIARRLPPREKVEDKTKTRFFFPLSCKINIPAFPDVKEII